MLRTTGNLTLILFCTKTLKTGPKHQTYGDIYMKIAQNLLKGTLTAMKVLFKWQEIKKMDHKHQRYGEKGEKYKNSQSPTKRQSNYHCCFL